MLELCHVTKTIGGVKVIDDCSFCVEQGTITALVGPNGSGKSAVLDCVSGIVFPDKGNILYFRDDMSRWRIHERADAGIARTFRSLCVFKNLTVYENAALAVNGRDQYLLPSFFGVTRVSDEQQLQVRAVLDRVKLTEKCDTRVAALSFGQQKMVSLARALLQPHKMLLLDEPVTGMQPAIRQELMAMFTALKEDGETLFIVERDMDFALDVADRIIVMSEGRVVCEGTPEDIRKDVRIMEAYFEK